MKILFKKTPIEEYAREIDTKTTEGIRAYEQDIMDFYNNLTIIAETHREQNILCKLSSSDFKLTFKADLESSGYDSKDPFIRWNHARPTK